MLLVVGVLVLQFALGFTVALAGTILGDSPGAGADLVRNPWVIGLLNVLAIGAVLAFGMRVIREHPRRFLAVRRFDLTLLPAILLTSLGLAVVMDKLAKHFFEFTRLFPQWTMEDLSVPIMAAHPIGGFVLVVIIAPVTEEYLFRGMLLRGLLAHHRKALAVLYSAILFGVMHANLLQFQIGLALGMVFGWWFARTHSTGPGLVGHAIFNAIAWFSAVFPDHALSLGPLSGDDVRHQPAWLTLTALAVVGLGVLWFRERMKFLPAHGDPIEELEAAEAPVPEMSLQAEIPIPLEPPPLIAPAVALADGSEATPASDLILEPAPPLLAEEPVRTLAIAPPPFLEPPLLPPDPPRA
ncbi:MAG TPA: CPBP family intramembrane glutamic endopeptidase [Opitutaceae bacterium]|nr:CPBP family intramembrane glutamic endopeptidase [Opitutaceae bacterium]